MAGRLFRGWVVVGAAFLILFFAYGAQYSFGVFFGALLAEFGWSRASLSGAFSLYAFSYCMIGFGAGRLTDRWGPSAVVASGGFILGIALSGMALVTRLWQPYVLYGVVAALGMGTAYVPCNTTVVRWFVRRRGLAVGIAGSGGSFGTFILPPVAQMLVAAIGWRAAYVVFGAAVFSVLGAVAPLLSRDPESVGLRPDGGRAPATVPGAAAHADGRRDDESHAPGRAIDRRVESWSLTEALQSRVFWMLAATFTATWLPVFIPLVHVIPFARDLGYSPLVASSVLSVIGIGAVPGRLAMGAASDRIGRRPTLALALAMQAVAFGGFVVARDLPLLYATAATFGFSYGAVSALFPAIVGDFFGRERAGAIVGFLFALAGSMGAWGPLVAGAVYDATRSYSPVFAASAALNVLALAALAAARPPAARRAFA
jgi:MFS transporter, OFA family, oxalate/formate antiporter